MDSSAIDVNIPRFNQAVVALATATAFVFQLPGVVGVTFAVLGFSWLGGPRLAPLTRFYTGVVRPRIQPQGPVKLEPAAPPRFAQLLGTVFLGGAYGLLLLGWGGAGWALTLLVTALATLAAVARVCVGCAIYEKVVGG